MTWSHFKIQWKEELDKGPKPRDMIVCDHKMQPRVKHLPEKKKKKKTLGGFIDLGMLAYLGTKKATDNHF